MLGAARDMKRIFPEAETVSGYRVSGARQISGGDPKMQVNLPAPKAVELSPEVTGPMEQGIAKMVRALRPSGQTGELPAPPVTRPTPQLDALEQEMAMLLGRPSRAGGGVMVPPGVGPNAAPGAMRGRLNDWE